MRGLDVVLMSWFVGIEQENISLQEDVLVWEYPRQTPDGEQVDILELMEIRNGLIVNHRIYWGWFGTQMLIKSALENK